MVKPAPAVPPTATYTYSYNLLETTSGDYAISGAGTDVVIDDPPGTVLTPSETFVVNNGQDSSLTLTFLGSVYENGHLIGFAGEAEGGLGGDGPIYLFTNDAISSNTPLTISDSNDYTIICFMAGTAIATPSGAVAIETLSAGDIVLTHDGKASPVRWVGRQTVARSFADPVRVLPIRIAAGALGDNLPERDLLVSPEHALFLGGVLVQAGALVNGSTITREGNVPESFVYYHVELADHALLLAEGVAAETFIDNVDRRAFDNWDEHVEAATLVEMDLPRAKSHRQVPAALRRAIAARADLLQPSELAA